MGWLTKRVSALLILAGIAALFCAGVFSYEVPYDNSYAPFFYVFGRDGDPLMGAEPENTLELFIDVPENEPNDVVISVYDPDTGGRRDWKKPDNEWDTTTEFAVYSGSTVLSKKEFGAGENDAGYYTFGPYSKKKGEKVAGGYRFKLVVKGVEGDDANLFRVKVLPESAESFVYSMTFRLVPHQGDVMRFYPEIPAGTKEVIVENWNLDMESGASSISFTPTGYRYRINDSGSGEWRSTQVPVETETTGRAYYEITKKIQKYGHAGFRIKDDKGNSLPIFFRKGRAPIAKPRPQPVRQPAAK